jgi:FKBP-type peptidyl-prolyl cis-trans isomerase 2
MKNTASIIGQEFSLDLGSLSPVEVRVKEVTETKVIVEYLNSAPGRTEEFSIEEFEYLAATEIN